MTLLFRDRVDTVHCSLDSGQEVFVAQVVRVRGEHAFLNLLFFLKHEEVGFVVTLGFAGRRVLEDLGYECVPARGRLALCTVAVAHVAKG